MLDRNIPKLTKTEEIAAEVAKAIGAGRAVAVETVDFNDPYRPKTCLEVDFPILPVNASPRSKATPGNRSTKCRSGGPGDGPACFAQCFLLAQ